MTTKKSTAKESSKSTVVLAAATFLAVAGAIFLYGTKEGEVQRKKIKGWALKAKGEILERLENVKDISEDNYKKIVDDVGAKYKKVKKVQEKELDSFVREMKAHWNRIKKDLNDQKTQSTNKSLKK